MKKMDTDGLVLCDIQGKIFEESSENEQCSSNIFIRRYINSAVCKRLDTTSFLNESSSSLKIFEEINEEYGRSVYGKTKFSKEELFWIGYILRYAAYVYEISSKKLYKIVNASQLRKLYYPYHTLDPHQAIDRIFEAKGITLSRSEEETTRLGVTILRRIKANASKQP